MAISRRHVLGLLAGSAVAPWMAGRGQASTVHSAPPAVADGKWLRNYRAKATITLLSMPVFTKNGVGSGFASIDDTTTQEGRTVSITFGAGSWPDNARGLNRLGFIRETVTEKAPGKPVDATYFAFITTSPEESLDQAKRALETSGPEIPYAIAEATGRNGRFESRLEHVLFPAKMTWRDYPQLVAKARKTMDSDQSGDRVERRLADGDLAPATFLYAVRNALLTPSTRTSQTLIYNGREYLLSCAKQPESNGVFRINALIRNVASGHTTPFRVWYEAGSEHLPPLRFEYQAKPYLRLTFDFDPTLTPKEIA